MKSVWVYCGAIGLGLMLGVGGTVLEFSAASTDAEQPDRAERQRSAIAQNKDGSPPASLGPVAEVVGDAEFDFGTMERTATLTHTFRIRNAGDQVLRLKAGSTTCKCTLSSLAKETFQPGEVAKIELEWDASTIGSARNYEQSAQILTNDPEREDIRLKIRGLVTENLRALPTQIVLGSVPANQGLTTQFRLFGSRSDEIKVLDVQFDEFATAEFFELEFEPLDEEEVIEEKGTSCGLLAILTVKSGLPLGPISQTIRIKADVGKEVQIAVPVRGKVTGDILLPSTAQFDASRNLLHFGVVSRSEGAQAKLFMFVKGEHRDNVDITVGQVEPEGYFQVDIGPPQETKNGKTIKRFITIQVPPGVEPINRLGSNLTDYGRIVLETTHPTDKQIPVDVKFAIE